MNLSADKCKKNLLLAKTLGDIFSPCYSRQIGAILVDPSNNHIQGTGYNGPPPGTPHTTTGAYLKEYFWPQLTVDEKKSISYMYKGLLTHDDLLCSFIDDYENKPICPRRIVNAKSGERSELCSCGHAERHAITNASCDLTGSWLFCWCPVPCLQCTDAIIQAGITQVHCLGGKYKGYDQSMWLFKKVDVLVTRHNMEELDESL